jgi:hypothetical protein
MKTQKELKAKLRKPQFSHRFLSLKFSQKPSKNPPLSIKNQYIKIKSMTYKALYKLNPREIDRERERD